MEFKTIIGLGNPGQEYEDTFHSAGRLFVEWMADGKPFEARSGKKFEHFYMLNLNLIKLFAFMNESGEAVKDVLGAYKLKPEDILVAHDDSDIMLGNYKLSFDRGAAGHKGVLSIIQALKTQKFWRLRIGIRVRAGQKAGEFVLRKIGRKEREILYSVFQGVKEKVIENTNP